MIQARRKSLTVPELAQLVNANAQLKRKLAVAAQAVFPAEARDSIEVHEKIFEAIGMACDSLVQSQGPARDPRRYRITCADCELDRTVEITTDLRNVGLSVRCCRCDGHSSFAVPEGDAVIACSHCGQATQVERIKTTA